MFTIHLCSPVHPFIIMIHQGEEEKTQQTLAWHPGFGVDDAEKAVVTALKRCQMSNSGLSAMLPVAAI